MDFAFILTIVVIGIVILINVLIYGSKLRAESVLKQLTLELEKTGEKIILKDSWANFFGLKSLGRGQIRGNGILALTDKRVYFVRYFPKKEISIPLGTIKNVETVKSYLGKNIFAPILKLNFDNEEVAFYVRDVEEWISEVNKARH
ncbi:MAG: hypothetical protein A2Y25_09595 [Candidatus Melainabacteria bacterium GWF2_37_15]|nr:MAG: hypothetical protein A2Y25_09595 [Candidatus Melainabacteria bacterium GWF2_37_15]